MEPWIRMYICHDPIAAQAVVGMLEAEGIPTRVRDLSVSPYPVSVGPLSERHIEVPEAARSQALAVLQAAQEDGVIEGE